MSATGAWSRVRALFHAALEQPDEARSAFLDEACGDDATLKREVTSLLAAHDAAGGFLETPAFRFDHVPADPTTLALEAGETIGDFRVLAPLGVGGMGEVYRAHDRSLGREVALKLLPPAFAADPERLARFERESRILASLNHPNIAAIHSIEHARNLHVLVLELVEGPTLADRLKNGPLPLAEAVDVARQLASALEAAHDRGVVHRDLKPANVKLTDSGLVKLLDFGLAKERLPAGGMSAASGGSSQTSHGLILGTSAYMSPEQARGLPVDKRTDVWAFGCVLFELLTGTRAFDGATASDTIAAVLEREPDWSALPAGVPPGVRSVIRRCLEKDPQRRLHDIADARLEIDEAISAGGDSPLVPWNLARGLRLLTWSVPAAAIVIASAGIGWWMRGSPAVDGSSAQVTRFIWSLPTGLSMASNPVISPDGRHLAFSASREGRPPQLYVRPMSDLEARPIARTDGASQPFWSPDSRSVGYFARGKLARVAIDGGAPVEICSAPYSRGAAWGRSGMIVFAPQSIDTGLWRVPASGGTPERATLLDGEQGENSHRWPVFLPDGTHFLYFVRSTIAERRGIYVGRIDRPASTPGTVVLRSEADTVYAPIARGRGALLSAPDGHIDVYPFDEGRLTVAGDPITLPLAAGVNSPHHPVMVSASSSVLVHVARPMPYGQRIVSSARSGGLLQQITDWTVVNWPRLSPDGSRVVSQQLDPVTGTGELWINHLGRGTRVRVTPAGGSGLLPAWSTDGTKIAYAGGPADTLTLTVAAADGTGVLSTIPCPQSRCEPSDWSPDGRWVLATVIGANADVWMLPTIAGETPRPLLTSAVVERDARFSPDGRLVAYVSEEAGRPEISILAIDGAPRREVVSAGGGTQPVWGRDGSELFFVNPDGALQSVHVTRHAGGRAIVGNPSPVAIPPIGAGHYGTQYDISPDGQRVYFLDRHRPEPPREIGFVLGWREILAARR